MSVANSSGSTYTVTAAPVSTSSELQTTHSLRLKVVSNDYSSNQSSITVSFSVVVNTPACDCFQQPWDVGTTAT